MNREEKFARAQKQLDEMHAAIAEVLETVEIQFGDDVKAAAAVGLNDVKSCYAAIFMVKVLVEIMDHNERRQLSNRVISRMANLAVSVLTTSILIALAAKLEPDSAKQQTLSTQGEELMKLLAPCIQRMADNMHKAVAILQEGES